MDFLINMMFFDLHDSQPYESYGICGIQPYEISAATIKQSGYIGLDNEIGSPTYFIDYTHPNGPDNDHKWLQSHPFY